MLRISKLADYATIVMVYLAKCETISCNARDIAVNTHLSLPTVSKLLKRLTQVGLLVSIRGVHGGYRLQRDADLISVADILYALDPYRGVTECSTGAGACALQAVCHVQGNWRLISQALEAALSSVTLKALAQPVIQEQDLLRLSALASGVSSRVPKK